MCEIGRTFVLHPVFGVYLALGIQMTRSHFRFLCVILLLLVFGCSSVATKYPKIGKQKRDVIAIVHFVDGHYLEQFEECNKIDSEGNLEVVCLDPPPMAIEAEIKAVIFGPRLPDKLTLATTGHFGLQDYEFKNPALFLIKLETDGTNYIMPRYAREGISASSTLKCNAIEGAVEDSLRRLES